MDETVIDDLKHFILTTVSQAVADLPTRDEMNAKFDAMQNQMDGRFDGMQAQMDQRFDDLDLKIDTIADAHAETLEEHTKAIKKLQQQIAT